MQGLREAIRPGGFVSDWLRYTEPFEYPEEYAVFALLAMASCAVDKRVLINPGSKPETWTNTYTILYGPSGARKSDALLDALNLLAGAFENAPIFPMNFTMEALRGRMAKDSEENGRTSGLILSEELSTLLGGRDYLLNNSLFLSKVWEGRPYETFLTIAHSEQIVKDSYVVLAGCSTPEAFGDLDPRGLSAGFLRRVMFVVGYGPRQESAQPFVNSTFFNTILVPRFRERFSPERLSPQGVLMRLSPEAARLNESWYKGELKILRRKHPGPRESHFINTLQVHIFKIGALLHLIDGGDPNELSAESLDYGIRLVRLLLPGTLEAYSALVPTPFARLRAVVVRVAGAADGLTDADLDKSVWKDSGATPDQAAAARLSLITDASLVRGEDGRLRVKR